MIKPDYKKLRQTDAYSNEIAVEYMQSIEEGLDVEKFKPLFEQINSMEDCEAKSRLCDTVFELICEAKAVDGYEFIEPSEYDEIIKSCGYEKQKKKEITNLRNRISGAWYGRIAGCLLGKTVEGIRSDELIPFLKATENYPMSRFITSADAMNPIADGFDYDIRNRCFADKIDRMPADDDTNYLVLAQQLIENRGKDFTAENVIDNWVDSQPKSAYFTAERVALINRINGFFPPQTAVYKNQYREYIGAQIRIDYYAYICLGDPEKAAELAFRDACISHTKNGIYGAMMMAAMIAEAAVSNDIMHIVKTGLSFVPTTSRIYKYASEIVDIYMNGGSFDDCLGKIRSRYDEHTGYGWCHTIPNACIVVAALLFGNGNFGKSICLAVQSCFDTDCNGATVGSILGMRNGISSIGEEWIKPLHGRLQTELVKVGCAEIEELISKTMEQIG